MQRRRRAAPPGRAGPGVGPGPGPAGGGREQRRGRGGAVREAKETPIGKRPPANLRAAAGKHRGTPPPTRPPAAPPVTFLRRLHGAAERAGAALRGRRRPLSPAGWVPRRRRGGGRRGSAWHPPGGAAEPRRRAPGRCRPLAACPSPAPPARLSRPGDRGRAAPGVVAAPAEAQELAAAAAPPGPGHGEEGGCAWGLRRHCPRRDGAAGAARPPGAAGGVRGRVSVRSGEVSL